jgi:hypothetical protein
VVDPSHVTLGRISDCFLTVSLSLSHVPPLKPPEILPQRPTEAFFREAFGVDAHLEPNHEDGSCMMTFGAAPPVPDPSFQQACYASCSKVRPVRKHCYFKPSTHFTCL